MATSDERYMRQVDIANPKKFQHPVTILGLGAIGSAAAVAIGKMGVPKGMTFIDYDRFEMHNVANQICLETVHLGQPKAKAMAQLCKDMGHPGQINTFVRKLVGTNLELISKEFVPGEPQNIPAKLNIKGIVINTPDNMLARKEMWAACKLNPDTPYVIDARMAGQFLVIYVAGTMSFSEIRTYEATLINDSEATPEACGARSIIYTTFVAGGIIANLVKRLQLGETVPQHIAIDVATLEVTQTFKGNVMVSNREALAVATAVEG